MVIVRIAQEAEIVVLTAIGLRAWEQAVTGLADITRMHGVAERAFLSFLRTHWSTTSVIESEGAPAGWAAREDHDGLISDLWIDPLAQGRGLGRLLLADVEERIVAGGFNTAAVATHAQNSRAIGFFQNQGYAVNWLSTAYAPKLDRDVESVGLTKVLVAERTDGYGPAAYF